MQLRLALPIIALLAACSQSTTSPLGQSRPPIFEPGTWHSPWIPSGAAIILTVQFAGDSVTGMAQEFGLMRVLEDSGTVRGRYERGIVSLVVEYQGGGVATYSGHLFVSGVLEGTWTPPAPAPAWSLRLLRESD